VTGKATVRILLGDGDGGDALFLELFRDLKELIPRLGWLGDAHFRQAAGAIPEHIGAVDVHRHRVGLPLIGGDGHHVLREHVVPALFLIEPAERLHAARDHVRVDQLVAQVHLERVGRLATEHAGLQEGLHVATLALPAGQRGVVDLDVRIQSVVDGIDGVECFHFATGCPPGKDL